MQKVSMIRISQKFSSPRISEPGKEAVIKLYSAEILKKVKKGMQIGITIGSRSISSLPDIIKNIIKEVNAKGAKPVLIAAMGGHGGGSASGRAEILKNLGFTSEKFGVPVIPGSEFYKISLTSSNIPVFIVAEALKLDGILVINRVKPHTSFHGKIESGLTKMLAVGLGGPPGAAAVHKRGVRHLSESILEVGRELLVKAPVIGGVAIVENQYHDAAIIEAAEPEKFIQVDAALIKNARKFMPSLPFDKLDLLIIEQMGKCFSGTGIDTNVIGRLRIDGQEEPLVPFIRRIVVLDLAPESGGNANGIGLADFVTEELVSKVSWETTYYNAITTGFLQRVMRPITCKSDRDAVQKAIQSLGKQGEIKIAHIKNTLDLKEMEVSQPCWDELKGNPNIFKLSSGHCMSFDSQGRLARL